MLPLRYLLVTEINAPQGYQQQLALLLIQASTQQLLIAFASLQQGDLRFG